MNVKVLAGLILSFVVGVGCKVLHIPVPSPPVLSGAFLVLMMSLGYWLVDQKLAHKPSQQKRNCGGANIALGEKK